ncbi:MAG: hypothetical protein ACFCUN_13770 [Hyphomicrobiaceae bacterium]
MSLRALPLMGLVLIAYNLVVFGGALFGATAPPGGEAGILRNIIFTVPMLSNPDGWSFSWGDLLILMLLVTLFVEIVKSTYTSTTAMVDHGLSMLVFVVCLIEFLMVRQAQTSVFFFITVAALIDVVAGYTIGIRVARRDIGFGGMGD